jgi:alpha-beta hydrolase superfamily lysophospholipase
MTAGRRASAEFVIPSEADGLPLHARFWPGTSPRGILVLAHGLGEHGGCYDRTAEELAAVPGLVDVLAVDFRGHGRSPGRRGFVRRYEDLIGDLRAGLAWAAGRWPGGPRFLLGHSNGGQVALRAVLEGGADLGLDGLVLSNPSLKLVLDVPRPKLWLGRVLRLVAPGVTLGGNLPSEMLSRDPDFDVRRRDDALRHSRVNPALFFGMVEGGPLVAARASEIRLPVLMILGGADPVVDHRASLALFERLGSPDKTLRIYPEAVHEPFNDLGRERVVADLADWLGARLEGPRDAG